MPHTLMIVATKSGLPTDGMTAALLGALRENGRRVAVFEPVLAGPKDVAYALTLDEAHACVLAGQEGRILERILQKHAELAACHDDILTIGVAVEENLPSFAFDLNMAIAKNLRAATALVAEKAEPEAAQLALRLMDARGVPVQAVLAANGSQDDEALATALGNIPFAVLDGAPEHRDAFDAAIYRLCNWQGTARPPRLFEFELVERASRNPMRIVLPEGYETRILKAAAEVLRRKAAAIILLGEEGKIRALARDEGIDITGAAICNPATDPRFEKYAKAYFEARKNKGIDMEKARTVMLDPSYFGSMMVWLDDADGMVSGAVHTTANTIRPALEFIKTKPGVSIVSSSFFMCLPEEVLVFADCAVNPNPTPEQLADIAVSSARTAAAFGVEPRVAMLSYSTGASGKGPSVDAVVEAVRIAREKAPDLDLDGPLQFDAASDPTVAMTKLPNSTVAGRATVFIFPDLDAGNNCYKAVQRLAGADAVGPVLQGLKKPVNDLSRGCTVTDIVNTIALTAIQAQADKTS